MLPRITILKNSLILLLMMSLCVRGVVPQGLMITKAGQGPLDFSIILCDGSKGLGSVAAFQKHSGHENGQSILHLSAHNNSAHKSSAHKSSAHQAHDNHHQQKGGCADCDLTWASSLLDEIALDTNEMKFEYQASNVCISLADKEVLLRQLYSYHSRAPPICLIA